MEKVYVNEAETPDGTVPLNEFIEVPRVPVIGDSIEFAGKEPGDMRIVTTVKRVSFDQSEDGTFTPQVTVVRDGPSTVTFT